MTSTRRVARYALDFRKTGRKVAGFPKLGLSNFGENCKNTSSARHYPGDAIDRAVGRQNAPAAHDSDFGFCRLLIRADETCDGTLLRLLDSLADELDPMELRSILTSTKVGALTLTQRPTLCPTDTIGQAAAEMRIASHGSALICSAGRLVGIFTERDLLRTIASDLSLETPLSEVMTANPKTLTVEDTLFVATCSMDQGGYRRLPVVDLNGSPVGIVDVKTIVHFLVEHFPATVYNQAAHAQLLARHREGA